MISSKSNKLNGLRTLCTHPQSGQVTKAEGTPPIAALAICHDRMACPQPGKNMLACSAEGVGSTAGGYAPVGVGPCVVTGTGCVGMTLVPTPPGCCAGGYPSRAGSNPPTIGSAILNISFYTLLTRSLDYSTFKGSDSYFLFFLWKHSKMFFENLSDSLRGQVPLIIPIGTVAICILHRAPLMGSFPCDIG